MSIRLKTTLIILILLSVLFVYRYIVAPRKTIQPAIPWLLLSVLMVVLAFSEDLLRQFASLLGIQTTSNLVFLIALGALVCFNFLHSVNISKQREQIDKLTQRLALVEFDQKSNQNEKKSQ